MTWHGHRRARLAVGAALGLLMITAALIPGQLDAQGPNNPNRQHYECYIVAEQTPQAARTVQLNDQFRGRLERVPVSVGEPLQFCNPVAKRVGTAPPSEILVPEAHLTMYPAAAALPAPRTFTVVNQFIPIPQSFTVERAAVLLVPTTKAHPPAAPTDPADLDLNHFWCYPVDGRSVNQRVTLDDQFTDQPVDARVERPRLFCNPVAKFSTTGALLAGIVDTEAHLLCYEIKLPQRTRGGHTINIRNQFETDTFNVTSAELLCVPSAKNP